MKKLFIYALLLMTGFAFYSCDDRFDNPVAEQQDPSNPNATWSYEVNVKFAKLYPYEFMDKEYKFEAPNTLYVYNKKMEPLGTITCDEEIDQDDYTADSYKFAGSLKGAIGDTLLISTADIDWIVNKQDGTLENAFKNGIMQSALAPIIVTNETAGKIGTKSVKLENRTAIHGCSMYLYATGKETAVTVSSERFYLPNKEFTVTFAKDVNPNDLFWIAMPLAENNIDRYNFKTTTEKGVEVYGVVENSTRPARISMRWDIRMIPMVVDLTEIVEEYGYNWLPVYVDGVTITQSGEDPLPFGLRIYSKDVTLKGINIDGGYLEVYKPSYAAETVLNIEGENKIISPYSYCIYINSAIRLKGTGTLAVTGAYIGMYIYGDRNYRIDDDNSVRVPASLTIEDGVTVKAEGGVYGFYISKLTGTYSYTENGERKQGEWSDTFNNFLKVNGKLEAKGSYFGICKEGILNVGETGTLVATSENAFWKIIDANITEGDDYEAKLETLVTDKSKFSDEISDDNKTRTIKKK